MGVKIYDPEDIRENSLFVMEEDLLKIFNMYPLYFRKISEIYDLGPSYLKDENVRASIGVYFGGILDKFALVHEEMIHTDDEKYPTIIYSRVVTEIKSIGYVSDETKELWEKRIFMDIVFPEWKENQTWYSKEMYAQIMEKIAEVIFKDNFYLSCISLNYKDVSTCAHLAYKDMVDNNFISIPITFH